MSNPFAEGQNPYASPAAPPVALQPAVVSFRPIDRIDYMRAYQYVFESPNGVMNIVWGFLCIISTMVIPIIGHLVFLGYQFDVVESLLVSQGTRYRDFETSRFGDYVGRSVWPFLVALVLFIPLIIFLYLGMAGVALLAMAGAAIGGDSLGPVLSVLFGLVGFLVLAAVWILAIGLLTPMILRAGLQQDFGAAFDFGWAIDFLKKTWLEIVLTSLFLMATGFALTLAGLLALCIGMFAAQALLMLAQAHFWYQLYSLYLGRGGRPIAVKFGPGSALPPMGSPPIAPPVYPPKPM